jgi:uncharacterized delta-60 repeat protein
MKPGSENRAGVCLSGKYVSGRSHPREWSHRGAAVILVATVLAFLALAAAASAQVDLSVLQTPDPASPTGTAGVASPAASPSPTLGIPLQTYAYGEAIVSFKAGTSATTRGNADRVAGAHVIRRLLLPNTFLVGFARGRNPRQVADLYKGQSGVKYAEPNFIRHYDGTFPNDPSFSQQWALHNVGQVVNGATGEPDADIKATDAWDITTGHQNVVVGVVDTGVDYNHSDLAANIWTNTRETAANGIDDDHNGVIDDRRGYNFLDGNTDAMDTVGHGTHVAGIIAAQGNNGIGVSGVGWTTQIVPLRACDSVGCDDAAIADAFTYAGRTGIRIVNASLSSASDPTTPGTVYSNTLSAAINASPSTLFVVAAGNGGVDEVGDNNDVEPQYPCSYTAANVLCVAATDSNDLLAPYSNYGPSSVDIGAPGSNILSTWKRVGGVDQYAFESGTSQATAMVAGTAALDYSVKPTSTTVATLESDLLDNAELPLDPNKVASGRRLNARIMLPPKPEPPTEPPGNFDTRFNGTGKAFTDFGGNEGANGAVYDGANRVVVAGGITNNGVSDFELARYFVSTGALDTSFDGDGKVTTSFGGGLAAQDVAIDGLGRIVAVGGGSGVAAIARYNPDGSLDTTFGGTGKVTGLSGATAYGVAIQADNKIVVSGSSGTNSDFIVARLNTDGSLDGSFGSGGLASVDFGANDIAFDVGIQSDGRIVAAGSKAWGALTTAADFAVARFNTNGTLDTTFDGDGKATYEPVGSSLDYGYALAIQTDGKMLVSGDSAASGQQQFAVIRINADGSLDNSFDGDGKQTISFGSSGSSARDVAVQPSGKIVLGGFTGSIIGPPQDFALARLSSNGAVDPHFGSGGKITTDFGGQEGVRAIVTQNILSTATAQLPHPCPPNGISCTGVTGTVSPPTDIIAVGQGGSGNDFALARYFGRDPTLEASPDHELNPQGQNISLHGMNFAANETVALAQCRFHTTSDFTCSDAGSVSADSNGEFLLSGESPFAVSYIATGTCEDPYCEVVATPPGLPAPEAPKAPISFAASDSISVTPTRGSILLGDAIKTGDKIQARAVVTGDSAGGTPTGTVSFSWCGPLVSPETCVQGGTSLGQPLLSPSGSNAAVATSSSVIFSTPGRYCFRGSYSGDNKYRPATDASKAACVSVRQGAGTGPVALDDFYRGAPGDTIADGSPGLIQNDLFGIGQSPVAQLVTGPTNGVLQGGLNSDGSFTYVPNSASVTGDTFTYRIQDGTGTSAPATVTIDLTGTTSTDGTRYRGTRYQGTRYRGTRYQGTRYRGTRYRTLFDATLTTYAECSPRWVWVNPEITVFEQTYLEVTAALYDAAGHRIASSSGFIAQGDFYGDLGEPLSIDWPVWNAPVPAGGVYAQVFVKAVPADPTHAPYTINSNIVGCQT